MDNFHSKGETMTTVNVNDSGAIAILAGDAYMVGTVVGIAANDAAIGEIVVLNLRGVFTQPKENPEVWAQGALVYWDEAAANWTTSASGNQLAGKAYADALSNDATGQVMLTDG
jgi:predicted RecA/RadA family phage recombinase